MSIQSHVHLGQTMHDYPMYLSACHGVTPTPYVIEAVAME